MPTTHSHKRDKDAASDANDIGDALPEGTRFRLFAKRLLSVSADELRESERRHMERRNKTPPNDE